MSEHSDVDAIREIIDEYFSEHGGRHDAQACLRAFNYLGWRTDDLRELNRVAREGE